MLNVERWAFAFRSIASDLLLSLGHIAILIANNLMAKAPFPFPVVPKIEPFSRAGASWTAKDYGKGTGQNMRCRVHP